MFEFCELIIQHFNNNRNLLYSNVFTDESFFSLIEGWIKSYMGIGGYINMLNDTNSLLISEKNRTTSRFVREWNSFLPRWSNFTLRSRSTFWIAFANIELVEQTLWNGLLHRWILHHLPKNCYRQITPEMLQNVTKEFEATLYYGIEIKSHYLENFK